MKQHIINAKAMSHTQLLGSIDLDTRQWVDGVLSTTAQAVYSQPPGTTNNCYHPNKYKLYQIKLEYCVRVCNTYSFATI